MNPIYRTLGILCALTFSASVQAQSVTLNLDPARTQITFTLGATLHTVEGSFKLKSGAIQFNPATGEASGEVVVDGTSGESGNNSRDRKMHKSVLESQNYPEVIFVPERVHGQVSLSGESHVQIQGLVKLHGSQHEITIPADIQVTGNQLTANLHFAIPYVEWGLKDPSTFVLRVEKKVDMAMHVAGSLSFPSAAH
ncbi:MAG TPA: YceI family protein [Candidatus Acidoferrales bacterium]|nr:YceI family protein [Candidatus Acidoferrales bacterium]